VILMNESVDTCKLSARITILVGLFLTTSCSYQGCSRALLDSHTLADIFTSYFEREVCANQLVERDNKKFEVNSITPFSGRSIEHHVLGPVSKVRFYDEGFLDGYQKDFYFNGQTKMTAKYASGVKSGLKILYTENGAVSLTAEYFQDRRHGLEIRYNPNGTLRYKKSYANGVLHGPFEDGTDAPIYKVGNYHSGKIHGVLKTLNGSLVSEIGEYDHGTPVGIHKRLHENGNVIEKKSHLDGVHVKIETFHMNGELAGRFTLRNSEIHGRYEVFTKEGKLFRVNEYENGELTKLGEFH